MTLPNLRIWRNKLLDMGNTSFNGILPSRLDVSGMLDLIISDDQF